MMIVLFALGERLAAHVQFGRESHTFALAEVPLVIGLFSTDPGRLISLRLIGTGLVLLLHRRQTGVKLLFNLALFSLETCVASLVFHGGLDGRPLSGIHGMSTVFLAITASHVLGLAAVTTAISLDEGRFHWRIVWRMALDSSFATAANTSLGLVAMTVLVNDRPVAWLLLTVVAMQFMAYRAYESLRRQHEALQALHRFTRNVGDPAKVGSVIAAVLTQTRELLKAERAELLPNRAGGRRP